MSVNESEALFTEWLTGFNRRCCRQAATRLLLALLHLCFVVLITVGFVWFFAKYHQLDDVTIQDWLRHYGIWLVCVPLVLFVLSAFWQWCVYVRYDRRMEWERYEGTWKDESYRMLDGVPSQFAILWWVWEECLLGGGRSFLMAHRFLVARVSCHDDLLRVGGEMVEGLLRRQGRKGWDELYAVAQIPHALEHMDSLLRCGAFVLRYTPARDAFFAFSPAFAQHAGLPAASIRQTRVMVRNAR